MKKFILIEDEKFYYNEVKLFLGRKKIDRIIAKDNLELFYNVMNKSSIKYGLIYGTLLGAIREGNFIEHDEDIDIFILSEYKTEFLKLLKELKFNGLELVRYNGDVISLMRNDEYIDVFFYKPKKIFFRKRRVLNEKYIIKAKYLENQEILSFLGMEFPIPIQAENLLEEIYGKDWRIPKPDSNAEPNTAWSKIHKCFPSLKNFAFYIFLRKLLFKK